MVWVRGTLPGMENKARFAIGSLSVPLFIAGLVLLDMHHLWAYILFGLAAVSFVWGVWPSAKQRVNVYVKEREEKDKEAVESFDKLKETLIKYFAKLEELIGKAAETTIEDDKLYINKHPALESAKSNDEDWGNMHSNLINIRAKIGNAKLEKELSDRFAGIDMVSVLMLGAESTIQHGTWNKAIEAEQHLFTFKGSFRQQTADALAIVDRYRPKRRWL
jgi:hypothetical protein